jgi:hypothetical protein
MSDLITRLLEAIEAKEQRALKAAPGPWRPNAEHDEVYAADDIPVCEGFALSSNQLRATVDFIVDNDPSSVLRLCHSHKFVVGAYVDAKHQAARSFAPASHIKGLASGLELAVHEIARGYGITEEEK